MVEKTMDFVRNKDIRKMKGAIPYYVIAEELGISETTLYNWLKKELTPEKRDLITNAINQIQILGPKFQRENGVFVKSEDLKELFENKHLGEWVE